MSILSSRYIGLKLSGQWFSLNTAQQCLWWVCSGPFLEHQAADARLCMHGRNSLRPRNRPGALRITTYVVLREAGNIGRYGVQPLATVLSREALDDPAADPVHGDDLKSVLPVEVSEQIRSEHRLICLFATWNSYVFKSSSFKQHKCSFKFIFAYFPLKKNLFLNGTLQRNPDNTQLWMTTRHLEIQVRLENLWDAYLRPLSGILSPVCHKLIHRCLSMILGTINSSWHFSMHSWRTVERSHRNRTHRYRASCTIFCCHKLMRSVSC